MDQSAAMTANESPAELAERLKLKFKDMLLLSRALTHRSYLNEHSEALEDNERLEYLGDAVLLGRGEVQAGGRKRSALLCDTFEAVIGALYLDCGIEGVNAFMHPLLEEAADDILINHKNEDPKSLLQEWAQSQGYQAPTYTTRSAMGPDHSKIFELEVVIAGTVYGTGSGPSKSSAAKAAARAALNKLGLAD